MAKYVDGYLIAVPAEKLADYKRLAAKAAKVFIEHGALEVVECASDDLMEGKNVSFGKAVKSKDGEIVIFSWISFKSKRDRDRVNKLVESDPRMAKMIEGGIPFDEKRMIYGGFKTIVDKSSE
ncbi:MAG: DUF1428 domain-containing protein [Pyrinomonadaceae bacterium]